MLKFKLLSQAFTYLGRESSIKYLGGNQIEPFTLTYRHINTETHIDVHKHTNKHAYLKTHCRAFSYAVYITDM